MAEILIPVGQDVGPFYANVDDEAPQSFDLLCGTNMITMNAGEYLIWDSLHGELTEDKPVTGVDKTSLEQAVGAEGVTNLNTILTHLTKVKVVTKVDTAEEFGWVSFAQEHRVFPLGTGLGNTAPAPWLYRIGGEEKQEIIVTGDVYRLWTFSHLYRSLWNACEAVVAAQLNATNDDPDPELITTPEDLLSEFTAALPTLLAGRVAYVDRSLS